MASSGKATAWRRRVRPAGVRERGGRIGAAPRRPWAPLAAGLLAFGWAILPAAAGPPQAGSQSLAERDLRRTVVSLVTALRVAEGCRIRLTEAVRRRAAELEAALLAVSPAEGARIEHAASMREAREEASRAGRAWCSIQRADVEEAVELLASPEAENLLRRLRALRRNEGARG